MFCCLNMFYFIINISIYEMFDLSESNQIQIKENAVFETKP